MLNERNEKTEKIIHLLVTKFCNRNCKYCCNKQYDLDNIPTVTDDELKHAEILCLTGGEPFLFCNPCAIADYYKVRYPNIKSVYVYTNALEFAEYLDTHNDKLPYIDGVNVSIKTPHDAFAFKNAILNSNAVKKLSSNRLYIFDDLYQEDTGNFDVFARTWQPDFVPADDSIFRKA